MFHGNIHRHLLTLSLVNWAIAVICWTISAYLGSAKPTGILVYTVLFVIGLIAVVVAIVSFVLADFGTEPEVATAGGPPADDVAGDEPDADAGDSASRDAADPAKPDA